MAIPFIDLKAQYRRIEEQIRSNMEAVLEHGAYIMGPEIKSLEKTLGTYIGSQFAVGCSSGSDALLMALMALDIGPGDAVFTSPFTFFATAEEIAFLGATPVFVDIDPRTYTMDPARLEQAIGALKAKDTSLYPLPKGYETLTPRAVIPVDLFGQAADYDRIESLCNEHGLKIIEDGAQAFGATYKDRVKKTCGFGEIGCTSFFPAKPLGCYGDGGMCFTDDAKLYEKLVSIRVHGMGSDRYDNIRIGINGRMDSLQAAILQAKFILFPEEIGLRTTVAARYTALLAEHVVTPYVPEGYTSVWAQYSVLARDSNHREALQAHLREAGIPTAIYYPIPLHLQTAFTGLGYTKGTMPVSERVGERVFSLPMHPYLEKDVQEKIAACIKEI
ncbi:MAG: DegT/DnrJ/EryC1/StrS family aminotransferase [Desulfoplanes sp.]|nr:DegT/DnrJ/EryC1/StrS family aminotransferase [Desulfoplanes sp.]